MARDHKRNLIKRGDLVNLYNPNPQDKDGKYKNIYAVIWIKGNKVELVSPDDPANSFIVIDNTVVKFV